MTPTPTPRPFELHYRHRENGTLDDVFETVQTTSKANAIRYGKQVAEQRKWWFMKARVL